MSQVLRPGLHTLNCFVELPTTCSPAQLCQQIQAQLAPQLGYEPHTLVLLYQSDTDMQVTPVGEEEVVKPGELDEGRPEFTHKQLLVCWLPKVI